VPQRPKNSREKKYSRGLDNSGNIEGSLTALFAPAPRERALRPCPALRSRYRVGWQPAPISSRKLFRSTDGNGKFVRIGSSSRERLLHIHSYAILEVGSVKSPEKDRHGTTVPQGLSIACALSMTCHATPLKRMDRAMSSKTGRLVRTRVNLEQIPYCSHSATLRPLWPRGTNPRHNTRSAWRLCHTCVHLLYGQVFRELDQHPKSNSQWVSCQEGHPCRGVFSAPSGAQAHQHTQGSGLAVYRGVIASFSDPEPSCSLLSPLIFQAL
jgi:hypothetical protein